MFASTGVAALTSDRLIVPIFFARQPEPDLEFTEEDLDEAASSPPPPMNAPKRSGKKPFVWIVFLLILGGLGYAAYDPEAVIQLLEPYFGDGTEPSPQGKPTQSATRPAAPGSPAGAVSPGTVSSPTPSGSPSDSSPTGTSAPAAPPSPAIIAPAPSNTPSAHVAGPAYSEGQRVTVIPHPARPNAPVALFADSAGMKQVMTIPPTATLTVLDGDLQPSGWMYAVRTEDGRQGWIAERNLKLKR